MCCLATAHILRLQDFGLLSIGTERRVPNTKQSITSVNVEFAPGYSPIQFGKDGRDHMRDSIESGDISLPKYGMFDEIGLSWE